MAAVALRYRPVKERHSLASGSARPFAFYSDTGLFVSDAGRRLESGRRALLPYTNRKATSAAYQVIFSEKWVQESQTLLPCDIAIVQLRIFMEAAVIEPLQIVRDTPGDDQRARTQGADACEPRCSGIISVTARTAKHRPWAYCKGKLGRSGRGATEAEDLVQEVLLVIHFKRQSYETREPFTPWAYTIARYKLIDYLRKIRTAASAPIDEGTEALAQDDQA